MLAFCTYLFGLSWMDSVHANLVVTISQCIYPHSACLEWFVQSLYLVRLVGWSSSHGKIYLERFKVQIYSTHWGRFQKCVYREI